MSGTPPPLPSLEELLAAMGGSFDPGHPAVTVLRAGWLFAQVPAWYRGDALAIVRTRPDGTVRDIETASTAFRTLGIDVDLTVARYLTQVLITAAGGPDDPAAERIAAAIEDLADARAAVAEAPATGHAHDDPAEYHFARACHTYETLRTGHPPANMPAQRPRLPSTTPPPLPPAWRERERALPIIGGNRCITCGEPTATGVTLHGRRTWTLAMVCLLGGHYTIFASLAGRYLTARVRARPVPGFRCRLCDRCAVAGLGIDVADPGPSPAPAKILSEPDPHAAAANSHGMSAPPHTFGGSRWP
ncbi:hypothetical protein [Nocardia blacklockiae]|uniref:hypothetical protein n=1 Tax=Nocardia blacklockiae TaxID=480036 RepID=UPI0018963C8C|nr:hypothetical protein [Nocardia blacklockiae]MBF6176010.1 hypothetical protein [Nocardia blacklockiae]